MDDLAEAHLAALERLEPGRQMVLNLGTQRGHSVREVIEAARKVTRRDIPVVESPRRPGDAPAMYALADRAEQVLGWRAKVRNLEEVIASAWRWHSAHPDGYGS